MDLRTMQLSRKEKIIYSESSCQIAYVYLEDPMEGLVRDQRLERYRAQVRLTLGNEDQRQF